MNTKISDRQKLNQIALVRKMGLEDRTSLLMSENLYELEPNGSNFIDVVLRNRLTKIRPAVGRAGRRLRAAGGSYR